ncbi:MAG: phenylalanine--tRNA ligase subunit alpha [Candidatus Marsarchaeota archaeon]|jgi:phenylalanyl-tRNA synthetase alpha chain|nr:phenylalanine--tRNA ligase subunit alpha [Candidatus Marsarchaeota archaeon]MCL5418907.1 phenylalanine--tRNA ligase subunit alpha [Candidatus Marsarchaeota archaeon]
MPASCIEVMILHEYEAKLLNFLKEKGSADFEELKRLGLNEDSLRWAIEELAKAGAISVEKEVLQDIALTDEGRRYLKEFPEEELLNVLSRKGSMDLREISNEIGLIWAKRNGWVEIKNGKALLTESGKKALNASYALKESLNAASHGARSSDLATLEKRNLVMVKSRSVIKRVSITSQGMKLSPEQEGIGALTRELIKSNAWKGKEFKPYDINASTEAFYPARTHPLHEYIDTIRGIWLGMGFTEVTGPIIESAFWNFDALFSPQDHPTRDMQDTFFLSNPKTIDIEDIETLSRVRSMHSHAWKERWSKELAKQALLRTHTTSVSAHYMRKFANAINASYPVKLFSVGRVFRNESIDYKHLSELYQMDGIIIGDKLSLSNLIDTLKSFYDQLGFHDVKFRPSFFPFVEPGLEVYYYDEHFKDNIELCGAGVIRKEITKAMGLDKSVLAWGGGVERLLMRGLGIERIAEIYDNNIGWLRKRAEIIG